MNIKIFYKFISDSWVKRNFCFFPNFFLAIIIFSFWIFSHVTHLLQSIMYFSNAMQFSQSQLLFIFISLSWLPHNLHFYSSFFLITRESSFISNKSYSPSFQFKVVLTSTGITTLPTESIFLTIIKWLSFYKWRRALDSNQITNRLRFA